MKIAIDASQLKRDNAGINQYLNNVITELVPHENLKITLVTKDTLDFPGVEVVNLGKSKWWQLGGWGWYWKLGKYLSKHKYDALLVASLNPAAFFFSKTVTIVHDLAPVTHPQTVTREHRWKFKLNLVLNIKFAQKLVCVTETTKQTLLKQFPHYGKDIAISGEGLNTWAKQETSQQEVQRVKNKLELPEKYLLSLGTIQPRKNYQRQIQAFAQLSKQNPDLHYVIAGGRGWYFQEVFAEVEKLGLQHKVHFPGFIDAIDMPGLFDGAQAFSFCSLEEGFGLPLIEAHARGLPIVCSAIPVFKELDDLKLNYVNPNSVSAIKNGMQEVLEANKATPGQNFWKTYSWSQVADRIATILQRK